MLDKCKQYTMNTTGKVIAGILLGATIGTLAGLLIAPTSGFRTRKNLNKKAKKLIKQLRGLMNSKKTTSPVTRAKRNGRATIAAHIN
jgi:gas vesicle protein